MRRRIVLATVIILPLLSAAAIAVWILRDRAEATRTKELLAQWQAAGGALTLAELKPEPIPDEQNAAVLYRDVGLRMLQLDEGTLWELTSYEVNARSSDIYDEHYELLQMAVRAGERTECEWYSPYLLDNRFANAPHLDFTSKIAAALVFAALVELDRGNYPEAIGYLESRRQCAKHLATGPSDWDLGRAYAMNVGAIREFYEQFDNIDLPSSDLSGMFDQVVMNEDVHRVILNEGTSCADAIEYLYDYHGRDYQRHVARILDWHLRFLREWDQAQQISPALVSELKELQDFTYERGMGLPHAWDKAVFWFHEARRWELAAQTAVALRRYRSEHGSYPDTWDMPIDPLSGQPMVYRRTDAGFEITGSLARDENPLLW